MSGSVNFAVASACGVLTPVISITVAGGLTQLSCSSAPQTVAAKALKLIARANSLIGLLRLRAAYGRERVSVGLYGLAQDARQFGTFLVAEVLGHRRLGYAAHKSIRQVWARRSLWTEVRASGIS